MKPFITSDCCDAPVYGADICSHCREHCEPIHEAEVIESNPMGLFETLGNAFNPNLQTV